MKENDCREDRRGNSIEIFLIRDTRVETKENFANGARMLKTKRDCKQLQIAVSTCFCSNWS